MKLLVEFGMIVPLFWILSFDLNSMLAVERLPQTCFRAPLHLPVKTFC